MNEPVSSFMHNLNRKARGPKRPPSNWLPMNSAPTDGTDILVKYDAWRDFTYSVDGRTPARPSVAVEIGYYDKDQEPEDRWRSTEHYMCVISRPLGWLPIPKVLKAELDEVAHHWRVHAHPYHLTKNRPLGWMPLPEL